MAAVLLLGSCGDSSDEGDGVDVPLRPTADLGEAEPCPGAAAAEDELGDSTGASLDLHLLELRISEAGICVRWTTDGPALVGTTFYLGARGPFQKTASGAVVSHNYGFDVELLEDGAEITFGLAELGDDRPNVLEGRVGQSGNTVSTFVPRSELDRPPANMPDRPPFPGDPVIIEARVMGLLPGGSADSWPDDPSSQAAYVDGRICGPPCSEPPRLFHIPRPG